MDLSGLNPPQREAVQASGGPLLVVAGAGSGKTRVITHRIAYLLEAGIPPTAICALTFTNKAAAEMRTRIGALIGDAQAAKKLTIGTFHALGLTILKAERKALGLSRGFTIYDTADQLGVIRELLRKVGTDRRYDVRAILTRISLAKNAFVLPEQYAPQNEADDYDAITAEIYPRYQEALAAYAAFDFDDLICAPLALFARDAEAAERWRRRFHHVLVDEFQDTNRAQLAFVRHLTADHENIFAVGDTDQSIYRWRGADPRNIDLLERAYPALKVIILDQNYRSTPTILAGANAVIRHNPHRREKNLWSDREPGEPITVAVADDPGAEAAFVAQEIAALIADGRRARDIAVLYRSNRQTQPVEEELKSREIPFAMFGGQQFFERKEVKDVIAYLRVALAPRDEIALRRIINYPARGIGATTLSRVAASAEARRKPLLDALNDAAGDLTIRGGIRTAIADFLDLIRFVREALEAGRPSAEVARSLVEKIDLEGDLRAGSPSLAAARRRMDNVESLIAGLARRDRDRPGPEALAEYLRQLSLKPDDEAVAGDRVTLTTLHGAKGLEFPVVFMIGLEEELLPHARTLMPQATDVNDPDHASDISEERRLMYVGMTRAMDRLYLSRAASRVKHRKRVLCTPSRFLLEIPEELVTERDVAAEAREPAASDEVRALFQALAMD